MDEEKITRKQKSTIQKEKEANQSVKKTYGSKLKNETSRNIAMREKLRIGKAEPLSENQIQSTRYKKQKRKCSSKAMYAATALDSYQVISKTHEEENVSDEVIHTSLQTSGQYLCYQAGKTNKKTAGSYGEKLHAGKHMQERRVEQNSQENAKQFQRQKIYKQVYQNKAAEREKQTRDLSKGAFAKAKDVTNHVTQLIREHPLGCFMTFAGILVILVLFGSLVSCGASMGGVSNTTVITSYTARDEDILAVNEDYIKLELELQEEIDCIEQDYPGYDEYKYSLNEIAHNPFALASLLTSIYEDYQESEVQEMLKKILDKQYTLVMTPTVEIRTKTVTKYHWVTRTQTQMVNGVEVQMPVPSYEPYEDEEEYEYHILNVELTNHSIEYVAKNIGLTEDEFERYEILLSTFGNKKYLFADDPYAMPQTGDYQDYHVPAEYLTDAEFANMLHEAEKYLGDGYVWGGSNPSTGFDCSGFVSYVINHSGNGWNYGRLTANGLKNATESVNDNDVSPGDLIFFQGTYEVPGASHVAIVVDPDKKIMLHCGNPIQYTSYDTNYWKSHFYGYGRIN